MQNLFQALREDKERSHYHCRRSLSEFSVNIKCLLILDSNLQKETKMLFRIRETLQSMIYTKNVKDLPRTEKSQCFLFCGDHVCMENQRATWTLLRKTMVMFVKIVTGNLGFIIEAPGCVADERLLSNDIISQKSFKMPYIIGNPYITWNKSVLVLYLHKPAS